MRISDWSSDVCSSDLDAAIGEDASKPSLADLERKLDLGSTPGVAAEEMNEKSASNGADTDIANPRGENGAGRPAAPAPRPEERSEGKERVRTWRSRRSPYT